MTTATKKLAELSDKCSGQFERKCTVDEDGATWTPDGVDVNKLIHDICDEISSAVIWAQDEETPDIAKAKPIEKHFARGLRGYLTDSTANTAQSIVEHLFLDLSVAAQNCYGVYDDPHEYINHFARGIRLVLDKQAKAKHDEN